MANICPKCGSVVDPSANNCKFCGAPLNQQPQQQVPQYQAPAQPQYQQPVQQPYYAAPVVPQNPNKGKAIAGMVLGICGLVLPYVGVACAIVGLILSILALKGYQKGEPGRGMALAGLICSIVGLLGSVIVIITCSAALCTLGTYGYYY